MPLIVTSGHDKELVERKFGKMKIQWDNGDVSEPTHATKSEKERDYLRESTESDARCP